MPVYLHATPAPDPLPASQPRMSKGFDCTAESFLHPASLDAHADPPQALVGPQHWGVPQQPVPHHARARLHHADQPALLAAQAWQAVPGGHPPPPCTPLQPLVPPMQDLLQQRV